MKYSTHLLFSHWAFDSLFGAREVSSPLEEFLLAGQQERYIILSTVNMFVYSSVCVRRQFIDMLIFWLFL